MHPLGTFEKYSPSDSFCTFFFWECGCCQCKLS